MQEEAPLSCCDSVILMWLAILSKSLAASISRKLSANICPWKESVVSPSVCIHFAKRQCRSCMTLALTQLLTENATCFRLCSCKYLLAMSYHRKGNLRRT
eukprot:3352519-Amphidinium_carterae.1